MQRVLLCQLDVYVDNMNALCTLDAGTANSDNTSANDNIFTEYFS